jgi:hypothetical protein
MVLGVALGAVALPGNLAAVDGVAPGAGQAGSFPVALGGALAGLALVGTANRVQRRALGEPRALPTSAKVPT